MGQVESDIQIGEKKMKKKKKELDLTFITKSNFYHLNATEKSSIRGASIPGNTWLPYLFLKSGLQINKLKKK